MSAVVDTHAAVWYLLGAARLSSTAGQFIDQAAAQGRPVFLSAISMVEMVYLAERGRIARDALQALLSAVQEQRPALRVFPVGLEVAQSVAQVPRSAIPDMPDRVIAATALYLKLPLITRDRHIQAAGIQTIW
jgi:PIN domain nuclease of toxin-antitoxin system